MTDFVHLHVHSEFSLLDGACRLRGLVSRAVELGQKAIAITDHGAMYGCVDFYNECVAQGVKPIIGCEVYVAQRTRFDRVNKVDSSPYHLVLLCKNATGYQNLIKLVSRAYTEGFYGKPRCDVETLREYSEGLICLSACLSGEIPRLLMEGSFSSAKEKVLEYKQIFGAENYYIELQNHGIPEQERILPYLYKLAKDTNTPIVATNDVHYLEKDDSYVQKVLTCIATNTTLDDKNALHFPTNEFYLKSGDEMAQLFQKEAIDNTLKIAQMCNFDFEFGVTKLPKFTVDGYTDNNLYFNVLVNQGITKRYGANPSAEVLDRVRYETEIITKMGYVDYFLIVADFIQYARSQGIAVGPGRGSGVGSICAYCMEITSIDPMRFNLLFERFLNPERISMPDFDVDFCYIRRQEVIDYVGRKYGADHVAQIVTFGTMAARGAIRDAGRAMGLPYGKVDTVAKLIPFGLHVTIDGCIKTEKELVSAMNTDSDVYKLIETARKIEGMARNTSVHAAGIVITRDPVADYVPLQKNETEVVTQYTMGTLERLGLLKMDFLGLRYLTVIQDCCKSVMKTHPDFDIDKVDENDKNVFEMLSQGKTSGIFQFESGGMTSLLMRLQPESVEDLTAAISLYRPGPMESIPTYIANRHNPDKIHYKHPLLKDILEVTHGCIVYQEQVMQICRVLGGYSYGRADMVRRAMAKKKKDIMDKERNAFIYGTDTNVGAVNNGVPEKAAIEIFEDMASFATYAFNKSHAAAYAYLAYQTAFLRCYYYKDYMVAMLTSVLDQSNKLIEYIADLKDNGIALLPPDINKSEITFSSHQDGIRYGLLAIKNLGRNFIRDIIETRQLGEFKSLYDFCKRMAEKNINKRAVEALIKSGAMDYLGHNRRQMFMSYELIIDKVTNNRNKNIEGQLDFFGASEVGIETADDDFQMPAVNEFLPTQLLQMEKESIGFYISGHPLDNYKRTMKLNGCKSIAEIISGASENLYGFRDGQRVSFIASLVSKRMHTTKNNKLMCFAQFEDTTSAIEGIIFTEAYEKAISLLNEDAIFQIYGAISIEEEKDPKIIVNSIIQPQIIKGDMLYINILKSDVNQLAKITNVLLQYQGTGKVRLCFAQTKEVKVPKGVNGVNITKELLDKLTKICGKSNIIIK